MAGSPIKILVIARGALFLPLYHSRCLPFGNGSGATLSQQFSFEINAYDAPLSTAFPFTSPFFTESRYSNSVLKSGPVRFLSAFSSNRTEPVLIFSHFHTGPDQTLKNRLPSVARLFYSGLQPVFGKPVQNRSISCMILLVHTHCSYLLACTRIYSFARVVFIHLCLYYPSWC